MALKAELPQDFQMDEVEIENIKIGADMKTLESGWKRPFIYVILPTDTRVETLIRYREAYHDEHIVNRLYDRLNNEIEESTLSDGSGTYQFEFKKHAGKNIKEAIDKIIKAYLKTCVRTSLGIRVH